jgi:phosphate transport system substrate-binding protein
MTPAFAAGRALFATPKHPSPARPPAANGRRRVRVHRRCFLLASGAFVAGAQLTGRPARAQQAQVKGAGASFPRQVLAAWSDAAKGPTGVQLSYDPAGTNDGIAKVVNREVDFATTAAPMSPGRLRDRQLIQFPSMLGPVVFTANLPGVAVNELKLTGEAIAELYLGKIKRWNDPKLAEHNPGLRLPDLPVSPLYRSDIAGTTLLTTTYLSRASEAWRNGPRAGTVVQCRSAGAGTWTRASPKPWRRRRAPSAT